MKIYSGEPDGNEMAIWERYGKAPCRKIRYSGASIHI